MSLALMRQGMRFVLKSKKKLNNKNRHLLDLEKGACFIWGHFNGFGTTADFLSNPNRLVFRFKQAVVGPVE